MATENYSSDSPIDRARGVRFVIAAHAGPDPAPHGLRLRRGHAGRVCNALSCRK
jgi:hypothetical protein